MAQHCSWNSRIEVAPSTKSSSLGGRWWCLMGFVVLGEKSIKKAEKKCAKSARKGESGESLFFMM